MIIVTMEMLLMKTILRNFELKLSGVAMDVFNQNPTVESCVIWKTWFSPHIGSYAKEGKLKMEIEVL